MHDKVLEHTRGLYEVLFGHDGAVGAARDEPGAGAASRPAEGDQGRRLERLRYVEQRLRPLRDTPMARVYWKVRDELDRIDPKAPPEAADGEPA